MGGLGYADPYVGGLNGFLAEDVKRMSQILRQLVIFKARYLGMPPATINLSLETLRFPVLLVYIANDKGTAVRQFWKL